MIQRNLRRAVGTAAGPAVVRLRRALIRLLERRAGITTTGVITREELGHSSECWGYEVSGWTTLRRILRRGEVDHDDVFIDFGSGLGRVLYQAAQRYPLRRVEGVELSAELTAIARRNLDPTRHRLRCRDVRLVTSDVLDYEIPDDLTIAYLYNPFTDAIFQTVVDRLVESVQRRPRRLRLIYLNPLEDERLRHAGFREVRRLRGVRRTATSGARMYELTPMDVTRAARTGPTIRPLPSPPDSENAA